MILCSSLLSLSMDFSSDSWSRTLVTVPSGAYSGERVLTVCKCTVFRDNSVTVPAVAVNGQVTCQVV